MNEARGANIFRGARWREGAGRGGQMNSPRHRPSKTASNKSVVDHPKSHPLL